MEWSKVAAWGRVARQEENGGGLAKTVADSVARFAAHLLGTGEAHGAGCLACGKCCEYFGSNLRATSADIDRWRALGRNDLLARVNRLGWIWTDPETGKFFDPCPYLASDPDGTSKCAVHEVKPDMCRAYPTLAHEKRCVRGVSFPYN